MLLGYCVSIFDAESSMCSDFSLISEEESLAGPVKTDACEQFWAGTGVCDSFTKSRLGRVALAGKE